jgi:2-hydroxychromene-2-carboxylate isomerase
LREHLAAQLRTDAQAAERAKGLLRTNTEEAAAAGVFGVPTVSVDGHTFFGVDGLPMLRDYLQGGDWFTQGRWEAAASVEQGLQA